MKKVFLIAKHEFLTVVTRRSYIISLLVLPLIVGFVFILLLFKTRGEELPANHGRVGVADPGGLVDLFETDVEAPSKAQPESGKPEISNRMSIKRYDDPDGGMKDLRAANLEILYVISPEYLRTGKIDVYSRTAQNLQGRYPLGFNEFDNGLRAGLLRALLPTEGRQERMASERAKRLIYPAKLNKMTVEIDGGLIPLASSWERISSALAPMSVIFLLAITLFISAGYLLQATMEENENRLIEVLLSTIRSEQLIWGKILGLGAAGLAQVLIYLLLVYQATIYLWEGFDLGVAMLGVFFIYWMQGHLLYAGLLVLTGMLVGRHRESNQFLAFWLFVILSPLLLSDSFLSAPNGFLARTLSFIPVTAPAAMIFRLSRATVSVTEIIGSIVLLGVSIFAVVKIAAKVLRTASLMYGKPFSLHEALRCLREN